MKTTIKIINVCVLLAWTLVSFFLLFCETSEGHAAPVANLLAIASLWAEYKVYQFLSRKGLIYELGD